MPQEEGNLSSGAAQLPSGDEADSGPPRLQCILDFAASATHSGTFPTKSTIQAGILGGKNVGTPSSCHHLHRFAGTNSGIALTGQVAGCKLLAKVSTDEALNDVLQLGLFAELVLHVTHDLDDVGE